jgi:hypothetical protein
MPALGAELRLREGEGESSVEVDIDEAAADWPPT